MSAGIQESKKGARMWEGGGRKSNECVAGTSRPIRAAYKVAGQAAEQDAESVGRDRNLEERVFCRDVGSV